MNGTSIIGYENLPTFWMPTAVVEGQGYDPQTPIGTYPPHGNYWHYLLGYLAPVCRALEEQRNLIGLNSKIIVNLQSSSNATMDGIAKEILESDQIELNFLAVEMGANSSLLSMLKRFDVLIYRRFLGRGAPLQALNIQLRTRLRRWKWRRYPPVLPNNMTSTGMEIPIPAKDFLPWWFKASLPSDPDYLRDIRALKNAVSRLQSESCSSEYQKKVVIIRRPRTASQTRVLRNDEVLKKQLLGLGIPTVIYEPGQHSFRCQVSVFQNAKGVIGLRGAEFANLLWCERPIPIILIQQEAIHKYDPPQSRLAEFLDLKIAFITRNDRNENIEVDVNLDEIIPFFTQN